MKNLIFSLSAALLLSSAISNASVTQISVGIQCDFDHPAEQAVMTIPNADEISVSVGSLSVDSAMPWDYVDLVTPPTLTVAGITYVGVHDVGDIEGSGCTGTDEVDFDGTCIPQSEVSGLPSQYGMQLLGSGGGSLSSTVTIDLSDSTGLAAAVSFDIPDKSHLVPYQLVTTLEGRPVTCAMSVLN